MYRVLGPLVLCAVLLLYFPAIVYKENADFFESSFRYIALLLGSICLSSTVLLWLPSLLFNRKWQHRYSILLTSLAFIGWLIGVFLIYDAGLLDGQNRLRAPSQLYQYTELFITIALFVILYLAGSKWPRILGHLALFLILMSAGLFAVALVTDTKQFKLRPGNHDLLQASAQKNVLVFLFDSFQSDIFEALLRDNPSFTTELQGFTFFKNTACPAPTTYLSIPAIHSGISYDRNQSLPSYYEEAVRNKSFVAKLSSAGYDASLINSIGPCPAGAKCAGLGDVTGSAWSSVLRDVSELIGISLYRFVPAMYKDEIYNPATWRNRIMANIEFLKNLAHRSSPLTDRPVVRFIHLYITHSPVVSDADCQWIYPQPWRWEPVKGQSQCAVKLFIDYLRMLKQSKIYDRSVIVLLSDHGAGLIRGNEPRIMAKAKALLLIKPFDNNDPLKISDKFVYIGDVPQTICQLTADCKMNDGIFVFSDRPIKRSVPFLEYTWQRKFWRSDSIPIQAAWRISGPVDNIFFWHKEISSHQHSQSDHLDFSTRDPEDYFGLGWSATETRQGKTFRKMEKFSQIFLPLKLHKRIAIEASLLTAGANDYSLSLYIDDSYVAATPMPDGSFTARFLIPAELVVNPVSRLTFEIGKDKKRNTKKSKQRLIVAFDSMNISYL